MLYEESHEKALRLGDVLQGYVLSAACIEELPIPPTGPMDYTVTLTRPRFCAVLTPCCSIENDTMALSPLEHVRTSFFGNPYLAADLTRVNRIMAPELTLPPHAWREMSQEEKERRFQRGPGYAFPELFVYAPHDLLPEYSVHRKEGVVVTNHYMVDFQRIHRIECSKIKRNSHEALLHTKVLQLSAEARGELREKLADYFARGADADV